MALGLISLRKAVLLTLAVHLAIQSCGLILREVLPPSLAAIQPVVVAAADELLENKQNKGTFVDYFNCDSSDDFDHHHQLSEVTRVAITGCDYDHDQNHCHLKNGTSMDFLVEFLPEKNYREVVLNINLQWPIFYPLISRERVCATELACPLVAGQKSTILLPNITVTVPSYVPQMMLENIQLNGTIVEVDEDEDENEDDDDDEEEGKTGDTVSCFVFYVSVDKGQVL